MPKKILAQAGISLADVYDIEGSIVGVQELDAHEVKVVHDLGPQIHSERVLAGISLGQTGDMLQNVNFEFTTGAFVDAATRVLGLVVIGDNDPLVRMNFVCVSLVNPSNGRELPVWAWDQSDDLVTRIRWSDDGAATGNFRLLKPRGYTALPNMITRIGLDAGMAEFVTRGQTDAFGAGTIELFTLIHFARPTIQDAPPGPGDPSSHGLPIPSW